MIKVLDEHERTMAFAEVALGQIKSLRQTAVPRNYEIWYVYATGYNAPLNKIINETLARNGKLTEADLEQIYDTYLSQIKTTDRIDKVGARVINEIDDVMSLITDALGHVGELRRQPGRREPETVGGAEPRPDQSGRRSSWCTPRARCATPTRRWKTGWRCRRPEISNLQQSLEAIRAESLTDPLTGLGNRKYFDRADRRRRAERRWRAASRCRC